MSERNADSGRIRRPLRINLAFRRYLRLPHGVADGIVSALQRWRNPRARTRSRVLAASLLPDSAGLTVDERSGGLELNHADWPCLGPAARAAAALVPAAGDLAARARAANKHFLLSVRSDVELATEPDIMALALNGRLLRLVARYLGEAPSLSSMRLWWTPANETLRSSQRFHLDAEGPRQLKLFLNLEDVTEDAGPLTWLDADLSEAAGRKLGFRRGRLDDEVLATTGYLERAHRFIRPAGAALLADTSRCLHYGSRGNLRPRGVLMIQYVPGDAPRAQYPAWPRISAEGDGDPFAAVALGRRL